MKAISLHQPYASLISVGAKGIETRDWPAPLWLQGHRIAIHAAKKKVRVSDFSTTEEYWRITEALGQMWLPKLPYGAVVATAVIVDIRQVRTPNDAPQQHIDDYHFGSFTVGRWMWFLAHVEKVDPPFPARGYQKFWEIEPEWENRL